MPTKVIILKYVLELIILSIWSWNRVLFSPQPYAVFWIYTQIRLSGSSNHINTKTKCSITALVKELYITLLDQEIGIQHQNYVSS